MKKVEIEIDDELFGDWEPVAFRIPKEGEYFAHLSGLSIFGLQPLVAGKNEVISRLIIKKTDKVLVEEYAAFFKLLIENGFVDEVVKSFKRKRN